MGINLLRFMTDQFFITKINFLKGKPDEFLSWLCHLLDLKKIHKNDYIICKD